MDSIKTLKTRIAPLMIVAALGSLLSACGSDRGIEMAEGLGKGSQVISAQESQELVSASAPAVDEAPAVVVNSQAPAQTQVALTAPAAPAQSIVSSAPTAQMAVGRVALTWTPPTENTDGSALANLAGYRVYFGNRADALTQSVEITNPGLTAYVIENLPKGVTYFAVAAYNASGAESALSGVGSKTIS